jgi:hypothetical protein
LVVEHRVVPAAVVVVAWPAVVEVVVGAAVVGVVGVVVVTVVEVELPDEHAARTRPPRHTPPIRLITRFFISFSLLLVAVSASDRQQSTRWRYRLTSPTGSPPAHFP